jgi:hypothetical protein
LHELDVDVLEFQASGFDLREVEDLVDHREQHLARTADRLAEFTLLRRQRRVEQQFGRADHAVHRRADLVAHRGHEVGLGVRSGFGARDGEAQAVLTLGDAKLHGAKGRIEHGDLIVALDPISDGYLNPLPVVQSMLRDAFQASHHVAAGREDGAEGDEHAGNHRKCQHHLRQRPRVMQFCAHRRLEAAQVDVQVFLLRSEGEHRVARAIRVEHGACEAQMPAVRCGDVAIEGSEFALGQCRQTRHRGPDPPVGVRHLAQGRDSRYDAGARSRVWRQKLCFARQRVSVGGDFRLLQVDQQVVRCREAGVGGARYGLRLLDSRAENGDTQHQPEDEPER